MLTGPAKVLSDEDTKKIHDASLDILERTGTNILHDGILERLDDAGARVDRSSRTARFSASMVEDLIRKAPHTIALYSRGERETIEIGNGVTHSVSGFDATFIQDFVKNGRYPSGERRPIKTEEVGNFAMIADRLEDIDIVGVQGIPQDVPQDKAEVYAVKMLLENTAKHIVIAPDTGLTAQTIFKMTKSVTRSDDIGSKPVLSCHISPSAPLRWTPAACDIIMHVLEEGVPFYI
ncbi:MAG TPA: hypothetical protein ENI15_20850, partial [Spirochaetes bacterium]|nr:hypothetical protein [Spirochaetota bacterium]